MSKTIRESIIKMFDRMFATVLRKSYISTVNSRWNKDFNVLISDKHDEADLSLFGNEEVMIYPKGTNIGRILIDSGLAKSWAEIKGSFWKDYEIPEGWTSLLLDGLSIQREDWWNTRRNFSGIRPHRLTILKWEDKI